MSRFAHRALLAPLLATALLLTACGGDDADQAAAPAPTGSAQTSPEVAVTSPDAAADPAAEATTPAAEEDEEGKGKDKDDAKQDDEPATADTPAADAAPAEEKPAEEAPASDEPAAPQRPAKLRPSTERAQNDALLTLAVLETCWGQKSSYRQCQPPEVLKDFGGSTVDSKRPTAGQVAITNASRQTFKIIATDKSGTRWIVSKSRSGDVSRKCKKKSGKVCDPASW